jgi:hypothetical protein
MKYDDAAFAISESQYGGPVFSVIQLASLDPETGKMKLKVDFYFDLEGESYRTCSEAEATIVRNGGGDVTWGEDSCRSALRSFLAEVTREAIKSAYDETHDAKDGDAFNQE